MFEHTICPSNLQGTHVKERDDTLDEKSNLYCYVNAS